MTRALTTAYAGHGDIAEANIGAVLDNFLPPELGMVYIPERVPRIQAGLKKVVGWLETEVGKEGTIPVPDLIQALLDRNAALADEGKDPDDLVLVMVFDKDNEEDVELAKAAIGAGIHVADLARAGDDVLLGSADAEITFEEEVPDVPEDATPPFEGGSPVASPAEQVQAARDAGVAAAKAVADARESAEALLAAGPPPAAAPGLGFQVNINIQPDGIRLLAQLIVEAMGVQAAASVANGKLASVTPIGSTVPTGEDPAGQPPGTTVYYYNRAAGTYRPARGKARDTEDRVFLTPDQVKEVKDSRLLA